MQRLLNILCKDCLQYEKSELIIRLLVVFASTETKKTKMKEEYVGVWKSIQVWEYGSDR